MGRRKPEQPRLAMGTERHSLMAAANMETVDFCCYDNSFKAVTLADLKTMQIEVILSGNALYSQKWAYREAINAAQSKEELEAIAIEFTFSDFSEQVEGETE